MAAPLSASTPPRLPSISGTRRSGGDGISGGISGGGSGVVPHAMPTPFGGPAQGNALAAASAAAAMLDQLPHARGRVGGRLETESEDEELNVVALGALPGTAGRPIDADSDGGSVRTASTLGFGGPPLPSMAPNKARAAAQQQQQQQRRPPGPSPVNHYG
eukprot:272533-Chlamydomonas_euryale.AAC.1